jgi:uncharacterized damage-inducible protein DinB
MLLTYLSTILSRDLRALIREIRSYPDDESLWSTPKGVSNSGGNLVLHLTGNLRHFVGAKLGGSAYRRNRDAEFSERGLSREELVAQVEETLTAVSATLPEMNAERLEADFPEPVGKQTVGTEEFLIHLATHLAYHMGQIDYHRRIVTGEAGLVGAIPVKELHTAKPAS